MSLFKVRDFWSFDLNQLHEHYCGPAGGEPTDDGDDEELVPRHDASFIASVGRFHSVGEQDVFVCAHLDGFLCLIQLPQSKQLKNVVQEPKEPIKAAQQQHADRQLLWAGKLDFPIVDVKCGCFASTLKQSVAVLSFGRLLVYQVKRHQADLMTGSSEEGELDRSMMSHELVEHHRIDLARIAPSSCGFPTNLVVLNNHLTQQDSSSSTSSNKHKKSLSSATLQLPQRDSLLVQYTNQLMFTLVDHKKIVGHYKLATPARTAEVANQNSVDWMGENVGPQPAALLPDPKSPLLVVSTSDQRLHCLALAKLIAQSKQSVMKRVAQNLLFDKKASSLAYDNLSSTGTAVIQVDVGQSSEWQLELATAPLQLQPISPAIKGGPQSSQTNSRLLVMSRYNLDLYSSSGQHLWCHRSETPIVGLHSYCLPQTENIQPKNGDGSRMMSLVCSSSLSADKCNLLVMEEDRVVWSAMLNTRPLQIWRTNFAKMVGVLATLSALDGCLSLSYLGTNRPDLEQELQLKSTQDDDLVQLDGLDDGFAYKERQLFDVVASGEDNADNDNNSKDGETDRLLEVEVKLEAIDQWPSVRVKSQVSLRSHSLTCGVLQNIAVILEFDDMLTYQPHNETQPLVDNVVQLQLGSCWPDRREPLAFGGTFTCRQTSEDGDRLLPSSLKVKMFFKFTRAHQGVCVQEESFMLPLNMVTTLAHIDYCSGQDLSLADVQANLGQDYKRQPLVDEPDLEVEPKYFMCDLIIKTHQNMIELVDELVESDLICRGNNIESKQRRQRPLSDEDHLATLESVNLLAQSLDFRLRYKSIGSHQATLARQSSEDGSTQVIMVSIGLKIMNAVATSLEEDASSSRDAIVWIHLCDLNAQNSVLPEELIKQHSREWKTYECDEGSDETVPSSNSNRPLLISIECDQPVPVLFIQSHFVERLRRRAIYTPDPAFEFATLTESTCDKLEINLNEALSRIQHLHAISENLHKCLESMMEEYETNVKKLRDKIKLELDREFYKFHITTNASLSLAKRLINIPEEMDQQFSCLTTMTKNNYMNVNKLLGELEKIKRIEYRFSKLPKSKEILIEVGESNGERLLKSWPTFDHSYLI